MPRRVQDIVPNNHRSIRDIPIERNSVSAPIEPPRKGGRAVPLKKPDLDIRRSAHHDDSESEPVDEPVKRISVTPPRHKKPKSSKKWIFILMGIVVVVAGIGYVASVYFSRATFTIVPRLVPVSVNSTYIAQHASNKGGLAYEIAAVKGSSSAVVTATDGPIISTSAKGKVTIYNAYSAQPQRLIAGTRISDDTGRIYRLASSIVIPAYTTTGGTIIPGSIITTVTADKPGQEYNISKSDSISDFKIVAYKGSPRYETIYARLNSDIIGGFVGTKKTVAASTLSSTTVQLQAQVTASLLAQVADTIPDGYILYPNAYTTTFSAPVVGGSDPKSATITVQGTLYAIIFKTDELVRRIAGDEAVATFAEFGYTVPNLESLEFSIANQKDFSAEKKNTLIIKLKGDVALIGDVPAEQLKSKLAGLALADTASVLRTYKPIIDIEKSSGQITPPWSKVPKNIEHISVEVLTK